MARGVRRARRRMSGGVSSRRAFHNLNQTRRTGADQQVPRELWHVPHTQPHAGSDFSDIFADIFADSFADIFADIFADNLRADPESNSKANEY